MVSELEPPIESALRPVKLRGMVLPGGAAPWPEARALDDGIRLTRELKSGSGARRPGLPGKVVERSVRGGRIIVWPEPEGRASEPSRLRDRFRALVRWLSERATRG